MGIEPFLTASAIDCVVAQRLARMLCTYCKERTVAHRRRASATPASDAAFDIEAYEPVGCARCSHSGYKGRVGIYEVMTVTDEIREMTIERASADVIRAEAVEQGMRLLQRRRPRQGAARRDLDPGDRTGHVFRTTCR